MTVAAAPVPWRHLLSRRMRMALSLSPAVKIPQDFRLASSLRGKLTQIVWRKVVIIVVFPGLRYVFSHAIWQFFETGKNRFVEYSALA